MTAEVWSAWAALASAAAAIISVAVASWTVFVSHRSNRIANSVALQGFIAQYLQSLRAYKTAKISKTATDINSDELKKSLGRHSLLWLIMVLDASYQDGDERADKAWVKSFGEFRDVLWPDADPERYDPKNYASHQRTLDAIDAARVKYPRKG